MKSAVHFGAGNIGRGFIGLLLHEAGYHVTFVDVSAEAVAAINARGCYTVRLAADDPRPVVVNRIAAIDGGDTTAVTHALAQADLITTAVGPKALAAIAPAMARGLAAREPGRAPAVVIACENIIGASELLGNLVRAQQPPGAELRAIFANCAVDRIVPLQKPDATDPLSVTVEPFCEWIIDNSGLDPAHRPELPGATFVRQLAPYIERKLFTVNTGHAALAYLGYRAGCQLIHEAMNRPEIHAAVTGALCESAAGLVARHGFDPVTHELYQRKILLRFANPLLPDEIIRVGRSPLRKLGFDERLIAPARHAAAAGTTPDHLSRAAAAALRYDFPGDPEAIELQARLRTDGPAATLTWVTGLTPADPLHRAILGYYAHN